MTKFNDVPFAPCNDCANWEGCQEEAYEQGKADKEKELLERIKELENRVSELESACSALINGYA